MNTDVLIVGQGISGTFLSWFLEKKGKSCLVIDQQKPDSPSRVAAGIINPVTGRRLVTAWMAGQVLPFAWDAYTQLGQELNITAISPKDIIDFFPNPFMRESFLKKIEEKDPYVSMLEEDAGLSSRFSFDFGAGCIRPAYTAHLDTLLPAWRQRLLLGRQLLDEKFEVSRLRDRADHIQYGDITARHIIFCDGPAGADNPYFGRLPFASNKGEAVIVDIPGLPSTHIYKKSMLLAPLSSSNLFWLGSNYLWEFEDEHPSQAFYQAAQAYLQHFLKIPFTIVDHVAGLRPATLERRPFVGLHPLHPAIGILNGMGTKGCSLAPFFAHQLASHLAEEAPITPEADIRRFTRVLSASGS